MRSRLCDQCRNLYVPELVVLLEVEDELPGLAEVVFLRGKVRAVGIHRALHLLRHVGGR